MWLSVSSYQLVKTENISKTMAPSVLNRVDNITKSAEDKRSYRGLELQNHLKVLLVSDPTTDKSAAAMDVNVGECFYIIIIITITVVKIYR